MAVFCAASAFAVEITVVNDTDGHLNVAIGYYDKASGQLTHRGWWGVGAGGETDIAIRAADTTKNMYYCADYGGKKHIDLRSVGKDFVEGWMVHADYTHSGAERPETDRETEWVKWYKIEKEGDEYIARINATIY